MDQEGNWCPDPLQKQSLEFYCINVEIWNAMCACQKCQMQNWLMLVYFVLEDLALMLLLFYFCFWIKKISFFEGSFIPMKWYPVTNKQKSIYDERHCQKCMVVIESTEFSEYVTVYLEHPIHLEGNF